MENTLPPAAVTDSISARVLRLAWPVIAENLLETFLGVADTYMVARLGANAVAGVGTALQAVFVIIALLSAVSVGSSVLVAQAIGAGDQARANNLARQSLIWGLVLALPLTLLVVGFAEPIMRAFGLAEDVLPIAVGYLRVIGFNGISLVMLFIGGGVLRGAGDTRTPLIVTFIANVINLVMAYVLIFGAFGFPALGAVGSAWAASLGRGLALLLMLGVLFSGRRRISIRGAGLAGWRLQWPVARSLFDLGIPAAMEQILGQIGFFAMTLAVAHLGTSSLAAQRVAISIVSLAFLPGIGFAIAATALVGQSVGARRPAEGAQAADVAARWAALWMGAIGLVSFILARQIMGLFVQEEGVIELGAQCVRVVAFAQPLWALQFVYSGALRGSGNTRYPLLINTTGLWLAIVAGYLLIALASQGLPAIWIAFACAVSAAGLLDMAKFRSENVAPADS